MKQRSLLFYEIVESQRLYKEVFMPHLFQFQLFQLKIRYYTSFLYVI